MMLLRCWLRSLLAAVLRAPLGLMMRLWRERCGSFWVVDFDEGDASGDFMAQVERALDFIAEHDPRRARWIASHLAYIVNIDAHPTGFGGFYLARLKACFISYQVYRDHVAGGERELTTRGQQVLTILLASVIVHEATHARIDAVGVPYDESHQERIEIMCRRQESRFLEKAAADFTDLVGETVDWKSLHDFDQVRDFYNTIWKSSGWDLMRRTLRDAWEDVTNQPARPGEPGISWRQHHRRQWELAESYLPWSEEMLYRRGMYRSLAHNFDLAAEDLRLLAARDPDDDRALRLLATALQKDGENERALERWLRGQERGDKDAASWIVFALLALGRDEDALEWAERLVAEDADEPDHLRLRGTVLASLGRYEAALRDFDQALIDAEADAWPCDDWCHTTRAWLLKELGQQDRFAGEWANLVSARDWWCLCCESDPILTEAWVMQAHERAFQPGAVTYRAAILVCTDGIGGPERRALLERVAAEILPRKNSPSTDYEGAYVRSLLASNDEFPWREVPAELSGGYRVYVVDAGLHRVFLPYGYVKDQALPYWLARDAAGYTGILAGSFSQPSTPVLPQGPAGHLSHAGAG